MGVEGGYSQPQSAAHHHHHRPSTVLGSVSPNHAWFAHMATSVYVDPAPTMDEVSYLGPCSSGDHGEHVNVSRMFSSQTPSSPTPARQPPTVPTLGRVPEMSFDRLDVPPEAWGYFERANPLPFRAGVMGSPLPSGQAFGGPAPLDAAIPAAAPPVGLPSAASGDRIAVQLLGVNRTGNQYEAWVRFPDDTIPTPVGTFAVRATAARARDLAVLCFPELFTELEKYKLALNHARSDYDSPDLQSEILKIRNDLELGPSKNAVQLLGVMSHIQELALDEFGGYILPQQVPSAEPADDAAKRAEDAQAIVDLINAKCDAQPPDFSIRAQALAWHAEGELAMKTQAHLDLIRQRVEEEIIEKKHYYNGGLSAQENA